MKENGYLKVRYNGKTVERFIKQYDIVLCDLGEGMGCEKRGFRPCVIVSNNVLNKFSSNIMVVPLTNMINKRNKNGTIDLMSTHIILSNKFYRQLNKTSIVQTEDLRSVSKNRIAEWVGDLSKQDEEKLKAALRYTLGLESEGMAV